MFHTVTPEQAGISSAAVSKFIRKLEERGLCTHGILLMRGDAIFGECYWAPFDKDTIHRMYSQTKSFVGVAIGLLEEEGKLSLDDPICSYFPEKYTGPLHPWLQEQTIRQMLTMQTTGQSGNWFFDTTAVDRTEYYFRMQNNRSPAGMFWAYDSPGSQVLSALVEKLSGMTLLDYLKHKLFDHMGTFQTAQMKKCRNGDTHGDSAMVCTLRDIASLGRLLMNGGVFAGKRLMNEAYIREATSAVVDNDETGFSEEFHVGYGYQIWRAPRNAFAFVGMGVQLTICLPEQNLLFACISDNQGRRDAYGLMLAALYDFIVDELQEGPLPEDPQAYSEYLALAGSRKLRHIGGSADAPFARELDGVRYVCQENPMSIKEFTFLFGQDGTGVLRYTNAQGEKALPFGLGKNVFGKFPQLGYPHEYSGLESTDGYLCDCAVSAAWREEKKLVMKVQIIDHYLGNFVAIFSFRGDAATVRMAKTAEDFLKEYHGVMNATACRGEN